MFTTQSRSMRNIEMDFEIPLGSLIHCNGRPDPVEQFWWFGGGRSGFCHPGEDSIKNDRLLCIDEDAVLNVPTHRARQNRFLDVAPLLDKILELIAV